MSVPSVSSRLSWQKCRPPSRMSPNDFTNSILVKVDDAVVAPVEPVDRVDWLPPADREDRIANRLSEAIARDMNAERQVSRTQQAASDAASQASQLTAVKEIIAASFERVMAEVAVDRNSRRSRETCGLREGLFASEGLQLALASDWQRILPSEASGDFSSSLAALNVVRKSCL